MQNTALVPLDKKAKDCSRWQFNNKYVEASDLKKPSNEVAALTKQHTENQLKGLVGTKTMIS